MPRSKTHKQRPDRKKAAKQARSARKQAGIAEDMQRAVALHQSGQFEAAAGIYRKVLKSVPGQTDALNLLGVLHWQKEERQEAARLMQKALASHPGNTGAHNNLCMVLRENGDLDGAVRHGRQATEQAPGNAGAHYNLANALFDAGLHDDAITSFKVAIARNPHHADAHNNLGNVYRFLGQHDTALECYAAALYLRPDHADALNNRGLVLKTLGRLDQALESLLSAIRARPDHAEAIYNAANVLKGLGRLEEADSAYRRTLEIKPDYTDANSNYLWFLHFLPNIDGEAIAREFTLWRDRHCADIPVTPLQPSGPANKRPVKVGLLSRSFHRNPALWLTIAGLEALDPDCIELVAYSDTEPGQEDDFTDRLRRTCAGWRDVTHMPDEALVKAIRQDGIDVLIDMSGHLGGRLKALARRAAPVQVKWVGAQFNTTGLPQMDWFLADAVEIPEGHETDYTERVWRMPDDYVIFEPPDYAPDVGPLPALECDSVTFGCFNNPAKLNDKVVALWADILRQSPGSRLFLKGQAFGFDYGIDRFSRIFSDLGVDRERLVFEGHAPHDALLACYNRVDITLDPFPFSGGLTTCESLWMGAPVLTLPGRTFAARHSASHLTNAGLTDWIAQSEEDYVAKAVEWSNDREALADLRARLRRQVAASPLCDGPRFARNLERALIHMWEDACHMEERTSGRSEPVSAD